MSRPQKIIPPVKGSFTDILGSIAIGGGVGKRAALKLGRAKGISKETDVMKATEKAPKKKA